MQNIILSALKVAAAIFFLTDILIDFAGAELIIPTIESVTSERADLGRFAADMVNGTGLSGPGNAADTHNNTAGDMWLANSGPFGADQAPSVTFNLGGVGDVDLVRVWNYNEAGPFPVFGVDEVEIFAGATTGAMTSRGLFRFAKSNGSAATPAEDFAVNFPDIQFVRFDIKSQHQGGFFPDDPGLTLDVGLAEVRFEASNFVADAKLTLEIERSTGEITLKNNGLTAFSGLVGISLSSTVGALDPGSWKSISDNYDVDGPNLSDSGSLIGTVDANDAWNKLTNPADRDELDEEMVVGGGGAEDGATISAGQTVTLGNAWIRNPLSDTLQAVARLGSGANSVVAVEFVGAPIIFADLNFDGVLDREDWPIFVANGQTDLAGLSLAEAYQRGDFNGDGNNNILDMNLFMTAFDQVNGSGSFAAMVASVPEPGTWVLLVLGGIISMGGRMTRTRRSASWHATREPMRGAQSVWCFRGPQLLGIACLLAVVLVSPTRAVVLVSPTIESVTSERTDLGRFAVDMVNGTGLSGPGNAGDTHNNTAGDMWLADSGPFGTDLAPSVTFDLGGVFDVETVRVWNYNESGPFPVFGADEVEIFAGADVGAMTSQGLFDFAIADGSATTPAQDFTVNFPGVRFVRFDIKSQHQGGFFPDDAGFTLDVGLAEVRFEAAGNIPPGLLLEVDTVSGAMRMFSGVSTVDIDAYEITTPDNNLNASGWLSFSDQNLNPVDGGDDVGETWDETGGSGSQALSEGFLLGSTLFNPTDSINLGTAFNPSVLGSGVDGNLAFQYRITDGSVLTGNVIYVQSPSAPGDYDMDGDVDGSDFLKWQRGESPNPRSASDFATWETNYGAASLLAASAAVPEPCALVLMILAGFCQSRSRNLPAARRLGNAGRGA